MGRVQHEQRQLRKGQNRIYTKYFPATRLVFESLWRLKGEKLSLNIPDTLVFVPDDDGQHIHVRWLFTSKDGKVLKRSVPQPARGTEMFGMTPRLEHRGSPDSDSSSEDEHIQMVAQDSELSDKSKTHIVRYQQLLLQAFSQFSHHALANPTNVSEIAAVAYFANGAKKLVSVSELDAMLQSSKEWLLVSENSSILNSPRAVHAVGTSGQGSSDALPDVPSEGDAIIAIQKYTLPTPKQFGVQTIGVLQNEYKLDVNGITFSGISHTLEPVSVSTDEEDFNHLRKVRVRASKINRDLNTLASRIVKRMNLYVGNRAVKYLVSQYMQLQSGELLFTHSPWVSFLLSKSEQQHLSSKVDLEMRMDLPVVDSLNAEHSWNKEGSASHAVPSLLLNDIHHLETHPKSERDPPTPSPIQQPRHHSAPCLLPVVSHRNQPATGRTTRRSQVSKSSSTMTRLLRAKGVPGGIGSVSNFSLPNLHPSAVCSGDFCEFEHDTSHTMDDAVSPAGSGNQVKDVKAIGDFAGEDGVAFTSVHNAVLKVGQEPHSKKHGIGGSKHTAKQAKVFCADVVRQEEKQRLQVRIKRFRIENPDFEKQPGFTVSESNSEDKQEMEDHNKELLVLDGVANDMVVHHASGQSSVPSSKLRRKKHRYQNSVGTRISKSSAPSRASRKELAANAFFSKASRNVYGLPDIQEHSSAASRTAMVENTPSVQNAKKTFKIAFKSILASRQHSSFMLMSHNMAEWVKRHNAVRDWVQGSGTLAVLSPYHKTVALEREPLEVLWEWTGELRQVKIQLIHGGLCEFDKADEEQTKKNSRMFAESSKTPAHLDTREESLPRELEEEKLVCTLCVAVENDGRHVVQLPADLNKLMGMHQGNKQSPSSKSKNVLQTKPNWRIRICDPTNLSVYAYSRKFFIAPNPKARDNLIQDGLATVHDRRTQLLEVHGSNSNPSMYYEFVNVCEKCYKIYKNLDSKRRMILRSCEKESKKKNKKKSSGGNLDRMEISSESNENFSAIRNKAKLTQERLELLAKPKHRSQKVQLDDEFNNVFGSLTTPSATNGKDSSSKERFNGLWTQRASESRESSNSSQSSSSEQPSSSGGSNGFLHEERTSSFATAVHQGTTDSPKKTFPPSEGDSSTSLLEQKRQQQLKREKDDETLMSLLGKPSRRRKPKASIRKTRNPLSKQVNPRKGNQKQKKDFPRLQLRKDGAKLPSSSVRERDEVGFARIKDSNPALYEVLTLLALGRLKDVRKLLGKIEERGITSLAFATIDSATGKVQLQYDWTSSQYHLKVREFNTSKMGKWIYDMLDKHAAVSQVILWAFEAWLDPLISGSLLSTDQVEIFSAVGKKVVWKEMKDGIAGLVAFSTSNKAARGRLEMFKGLKLLLQGKREEAIEQLNVSLATSIRLLGLWCYDVGLLHFIIGKYMTIHNPREARAHFQAAKTAFTSEEGYDVSGELYLLEAALIRCNEFLEDAGVTSLLDHRGESDASENEEGTRDGGASGREYSHVDNARMPAMRSNLSTPGERSGHFDPFANEKTPMESMQQQDNHVPINRMQSETGEATSPDILGALQWAKRSLETCKRRLHHEKLLPEDLTEEVQEHLSPMVWAKLESGSYEVNQLLKQVEQRVRKMETDLTNMDMSGSEWPPVPPKRPMTVNTLERNLGEMLDSIAVQTKRLLEIKREAEAADCGQVTKESVETMKNESNKSEAVKQVSENPNEVDEPGEKSSLMNFRTSRWSDTSDSEDEEESSDSEDARSEVNTMEEATVDNQNGSNEDTIGDVSIDEVFAACQKRNLGDLERFSRNMNLKVLVNFESNTLLHIAASVGWVEGVHFCLAQEIPINAQNIEGNTALHLASANRELTVELLLVALGSDVSLENVYGNTYDN